MTFKLRTILLAALPLAAVVHAATLAPFQEAALKTILSNVPAEQRAMVRPQMEALLSRMNQQQVDMMLSQYKREHGGAPQSHAQGPQTAASADGGGQWGKAEADFDKVVPMAQSWMEHVSDQRDAMQKHWQGILNGMSREWMGKAENSFTEDSAKEACDGELNLVPMGRRQLAQYTDQAGRETREQVDRNYLRQMIDYRARYTGLDAFARAIQQPVGSDLVQAVRYHFAAPGSEADADARLAAIDRDIAALLEASSHERHKIEMSGYADQGVAIVSKQKTRDLAALHERTRKAAVAICAPGREAYERALVGLIDPLVPKVKPYLR